MSRSRCKFCPLKDGAMKLINGTGWVHIACVDLIPEIYFTEDGKKETIEHIKTIPLARKKALCTLCKQKRGVVISVLR